MHSPSADRPTLAFIGGTGPEGRGLALHTAAVGYPVVIGSRSESRAEEAAASVRSAVPDGQIRGTTNEAAASEGEIVFLTIPYSGLTATLPPLENALRDKIVVSAVAPVEFVDGRPVATRVEAGSAAQEVQMLLPDAQVVSAFQTVDAHRLQNLESDADTDVIVCSDDVEARRAIVAIANNLHGVRGLSGGRLSSSRYVEECTALLITLNRIYKAHTGIRFTGIDR